MRRLLLLKQMQLYLQKRRGWRGCMRSIYGGRQGDVKQGLVQGGVGWGLVCDEKGS